MAVFLNFFINDLYRASGVPNHQFIGWISGFFRQKKQLNSTFTLPALDYTFRLTPEGITEFTNNRLLFNLK
jgi:hypothetical protein